MKIIFHGKESELLELENGAKEFEYYFLEKTNSNKREENEDLKSLDLDFISLVGDNYEE